MKFEIQDNVPLAKLTSFGVGGSAQSFVMVNTTVQLLEVLKSANEPIWVLGYGSNTLVSDSGLPGLTICVRSNNIEIQGNQIIADAGVWWDDVVRSAIENNLWGVELMSEIPGSIGAAAFINITAYGQSLGPLVEWIEVWDRKSKQVKTLQREELSWSYKSSFFQSDDGKSLVVLRVCLQLSETKNDKLTYQKALDVASEFNLNIDELNDRRKIIVETRVRAGSIWHPDDAAATRTVGSFFRNPLVSGEQAAQIIKYDETGKSSEQIQNMNKVHGGNSNRISAAHVMLASGFSRGQTWAHVKLNDQNLLKIEALPGATAQEIYDVMKDIQETCVQKTGIFLEPEAQLLGDFGS